MFLILYLFCGEVIKSLVFSTLIIQKIDILVNRANVSPLNRQLTSNKIRVTQTGSLITVENKMHPFPSKQ